jgi:hypothetical protein
MSIYIVFFGKSQDFTSYYYDSKNPIPDFNSVIRDFDLLESKVFTVDDIKNKEILSRYNFVSQGREYCLLKLYSFAQAYSGNRIAGSIYGVGLLAEKSVNFTKDNLELLNDAKEEFASLSLEGVKFNKSNFKNDTDRIWKAIVTYKEGNLIDKVSTSALKINGSRGPVAFYVKNLFNDAIKLNDRIKDQDVVYFSEDLEHLKRTQNRWGKDNFPIFWEQRDKFIPYEEPVVVQPTHQNKFQEPIKKTNDFESNDISKLRSELSDSNYSNQLLKKDLEILNKKLKHFKYIIYGLVSLFFFIILFFFISLLTRKKKEVAISATPIQQNVIENQPNQIANFLVDESSIQSGIDLLRAANFIISYDPNNQLKDSAKFHSAFLLVEDIANKYNIQIENIRVEYVQKSDFITSFSTNKSIQPNSRRNSRNQN